ncbi:MAG TPA: NAD-dependent deacylase [Deltaproteobacteria bacterium]|jgi:NAD-dependent deacetylase|nr:MAG: NAD-dependent protein deacetylase [Deltaproteobacteria bacterium ADurb.Bin072]HNQ85498.1 NAD-dependent deacylase [Deltaproteobacteria bacterium]HRW79400.1 NAD-dependent deacylase [Desulfomonilia bacterium]HNS88847.1 NAD-dependent deacylase [Deltaproteobacteria bacterium]HOA43899.1 NAD-dependent deacylase [Deltaproteobacteria bacterium]
MDLPLIEKAVDLLLRSKHTVVLTGAGISTESGVPDFRSPGGIWERYDPTLFFYARFVAEPDVVWKCLIEMNTNGALSLWDAKPNQGHMALAELEEMGLVKVVITQNIDNLHQKAGSRNVIEFHGNMLFFRCLTCGRTYGYEQLLEIIAESTCLPPRCECGGILKPDAVFFGEAIPQNALNESFRHAQDCDLMLVIGTSAQIEPAASLPIVAKGMRSMFRGMGGFFTKINSHVVEINREPTPLTGEVSDFLIQGGAGDILSTIVRNVREKRR